jgi:uncharacterized protein with FMN-binding domain
MRVPHVKTLLSLVGSVGAMGGLLAAKTSAHGLVQKEPLALTTKTVHEAGTGRAMTRTEVLTGPPISITHGIVQVRVTMAGGHITAVTATNLPHDNDVSLMRSELAARLLAREVMAAQSAHVDAVSGATYTSQAYLTSLQAAIDAAGS